MHNNDTIAVTFGFLIFIVLPALAVLARRFWLRANRTARIEVLAAEGEDGDYTYRTDPAKGAVAGSWARLAK